MKQRVTWICLADGAHARIVSPSDDGAHFVVVSEVDSVDAHRLTHDLTADRLGRSQESANPAHHAFEPRTDPRMASKRDFIRTVAELLNAAESRGDFGQLILAAPARCLHDLRAALREPARQKITSELSKDLTKVPLSALSSHLGPMHRE